MPIIILTRTKEYLNFARSFSVLLNNKEIGKIRNGEIKSFEISEGKHQLKADIDWCSSPEIDFEIKEGETKTYKVGGFKYGSIIIPIALILIVVKIVLLFFADVDLPILHFILLPVFLLLLYYITFGRKNYLTLKELK